jgi:Mce-associated membrane protein
MPIGPSYRPMAEPESAAVPAMTEEVVTESHAPLTSPPPRWHRVLPVAFGAATVVLGALGAWAAIEAHDLRANASSANGALVDASATRTVTRDVTSAVNTIFSYSYADTARTKAAAQRLLTGPAIRQYNQLFALVQQQAPKEKLVVTTRVTNVGVELLTGGRSRLLIFANQEDSEAGTSQATYGGAMFAVTAVNERGRWLIESIDTFTGSA